MSKENPWADTALVERLRALWAIVPHLSLAEIGERLGVSKHAVRQKAHRLGLEPRPSPIQPGGTGQPSKHQAALAWRDGDQWRQGVSPPTGSTLPPLESERSRS